MKQGEGELKTGLLEKYNEEFLGGKLRSWLVWPLKDSVSFLENLEHSVGKLFYSPCLGY